MDFAYRLGNRKRVSPIQILSLSASLLPDAPESSPRRVRLCSRVRSSLLPRSLTSIELENGVKRPQSVALAVGNRRWEIRCCQRKEGLAYGFTFDRSFRIVIWGQSENSVASNKPMHTVLLI